MQQAGIPFEEVKVRLDSFAPGSEFRRTMDAISPTGKVPLLMDGGLAVGAWIEGALAERDFLDFEEPFRLGP